eukprot:CAMPEP_0116551230 /NCGR_PEP_ID=MMETSP0397-20121206/5851_1 /TAXON_ID=216820 /ORGANISM="Cyclophora tenuis, Strain ECT3854" /LENGTH=158 /DNA_ID=CAMNT_0004076117 /DNA_START=58 /DNA_END=531 /DNA_ORIENTATION=+
MSSEEDTVTLKSKDGKDFTVPSKAASLSQLVRDSMEDDSDAINVMRVDSTCLEKVVEFLVHHDEEAMKEIPTPLGGNKFEEIVTQDWYQNFVTREERDMIFDLLTAANYMGIKPLLDLTCLKVTFELTGKSAEEIRVILNLPKLTPEEEAKARQDHKW